MSTPEEKTPGQELVKVPSVGPKFNIRARYEDLNNGQKKLLKQVFRERFRGNVQTFYNRLKSHHLLADELAFFAAIFECSIEDLYNQDPPPQPSVYELFRKAKKPKPGRQARLNMAV